MTESSESTVQVVGGAVVPEGYEIWADGVYTAHVKAPRMVPADVNTPLPHYMRARRRQLTFRPVWISGLGHTIDTNEPLMQLSYIELDGALKEVWLGRGQVTDHRMLSQLGAAGLPIDSVNTQSVLIYLRAMEAANGRVLPIKRVGHRSGPYMVDGKLGWLVGRRWIGSGHLEADPRSNQKYTLAFSPHGSADAWLAKWREIREQGWVTRFLVGATFAPPLLRLLKCRTFILHHWGDSSHGKTATAVFALSAWGNPELLYSSLNRTTISLTEVFKHLTDLPVLFDEKQVSTVPPAELIYAVCTGSGRERGAKDGGLRQDRQQWLTVARVTGEEPLVGNADLGGQFNRVLQIHSMAFRSKREAEQLYPFTAEHFGHAGPMFLEQLAQVLEQPTGLQQLTALCTELREALINRIGVDSNHAQYAAVIATAQTLSESWLLDIPIVEAKERALDDATLALKETAPKKQQSYAEKALSKLRDHWIANPFMYFNATSPSAIQQSEKNVNRMVAIEVPKYGAPGTLGMAYIPHEANEILIRAGYSPERVWRDFHNNNWLLTDTHDSPLFALALRGGKSPNHQTYCIREDIFFGGARKPELQLIQGGNVSGLES